MAVIKLSGVAVPSCSWGSSHRVAMPTCQARVILPLGTTLADSAADAAAAIVTGPPTRATTSNMTTKRCQGFLIMNAPHLRRLDHRARDHGVDQDAYASTPPYL